MAARTSRTSRATGCRRSARSSKASPARGAINAPRWKGAGTRLVATLVDQQRLEAGTDDPTPELLETVASALMQSFDARNGSWGGAPKFPQPMTIEYLLRRQAGGDPRFDAVARFTLDKMADGGIHDQLGGGFHRYSTDPVWLVPHFEQMLYDNAQLARVYLHAWASTGETRYRDVATGTLDYMIRELTTDDGAFAASQDADTEGVEGLTFVWSVGRDPRGPRRRRRAVHGGLRRDRGGQLGGPHDPVAGLAGDPHAAAVARGRRVRGRSGGVTRQAACAAVDPAAAGPRRQGARGLERARDRRLRRRGATPSA